MKTTLAMLVLGLGMAMGAAHAQTATPATPATPAKPAATASAAQRATPATPAAPAASVKAANPQQNRMAACNQEAGSKSLKGDERQAFMKTCLSNKPMTQQDRMKNCNVEAKDMKGDARKAFMSECLKKK